MMDKGVGGGEGGRGLMTRPIHRDDVEFHAHPVGSTNIVPFGRGSFLCLVCVCVCVGVCLFVCVCIRSKLAEKKNNLG
jgi:hypothetical protein